MKFSISGMKSTLSAIGIGIVMLFAVVALSHRLIAQYTGMGNHAVAATDAKRMIQNYWNKPIAPTSKAMYFERDIYEKILAQPGCVGIRQYFAYEDGKGVTLVLVGVDAKGSDLVNGTIGESAQPCPPMCAGDTKLY